MAEHKPPTHYSPYGPYGPYDPMRHHHHDHPPYMVDRCADECDDQLPLFSQVGRGLQGDGYRVEVIKDSLTETLLEGLIYDAHTGALTSDWVSENINGGHLSYGYTLRPWTDPQTFVLAFRYVRPGRNADENGTVWSWTSPAIPYAYNDYDGNIASGVATLYLRSTSDGNWPSGRPTNEWLAKHEKLIYPFDMDHDSMNAPNPLEPYTVNLTYGIGGDIDAPNIDDFSKVLGITVENIRNIVLNSPMPTETIPDENLKKYIDRRDQEDLNHVHQDMGFPNNFLAGDGGTSAYNTIRKYIDGVLVKSDRTSLIKVTQSKRDGSNSPNQFGINTTNYVAGRGISITNNVNPDSTGFIESKKVAVNILAGLGINIREEGGALIIENTEAIPRWIDLVPGQDFNYTMHNYWYFGDRVNGKFGENDAHQPTPTEVSADPARFNLAAPRVRISPTFNLAGNVVAAAVMVGEGSIYAPPGSSHQVNEDRYRKLQFPANLIQQITIHQYDENGRKLDDDTVSRAQFRHSRTNYNAIASSILSLKFIGQYANLNNLNIVESEGTAGIWNTLGTIVGMQETDPDWTAIGSDWSPSLYVSKVTKYPWNSQPIQDTRGRNYQDGFVIGMAGISDGYNGSYYSPPYTIGNTKVKSATNGAICIRPWANMHFRFTLA